MTFTAGCMICLLVGSDSFAPETPKTALSTPAGTMVRQWCIDARKRLELAEAMQTTQTAHQARVDANLLCAKAGS